MNDTFVSFYFKRERLHIPREALTGIDSPPFVRFLISNDGKSMIMEPYSRKVFSSMRVPLSMYRCTKQRPQMEIPCAYFCRLLASMLNLKPDSSYRFHGKIKPLQNIIVFDLTCIEPVGKDREEGN